MVALSAAAACSTADGPIGAVKAALDTDGDGLDDSIDNCVEVENPAQENSNFDAEAALSLTHRGDACDPQPVVWMEGDRFEAGFFSSSVTIHSMRAEPVVESGVPAVTPHLARSGLRFCVCNDADRNSPSVRSTCANPTTTACQIGDPVGYDNADHTTTDWKTMTVNWGRPLLGLPGHPTNYTSVESGGLRSGGDEVAMDFWDVGENAAGVRWDVFGDGDDWSLAGPACDSSGDPPPGYPRCYYAAGGETYFRGVLAAHTPGPVVSGLDQAYPTGTDYDEPNRKLTFHYRSGPVQRYAVLDEPPPARDGEFYAIDLLPESDCWHCSFGFPDAFFLFDRCTSGACEVPFLRSPQGYDDDTSDAFASGVYDQMGQSDPGELVWVAVSEPSSWRDDADAIQWAAVHADGEHVAMVIETVDNLLTSMELDTPTTHPSARSDFGVAMSRQQNAVYVVGGHVSGTPTEDMWIYDIASQQWSESDNALTGSVPEAVLAAAYLPAEDALLVLDVQDGEKVRLLRVPHAGGTVTELASWDRKLENTTFALTAFDDGLAYAIACTDSDGDHTILRFERGGSDIASYSTGDGPLASTMVGSRRVGITVLAAPDPPTPTGHALEAFSAASSTTSERCF